MRKWLFALLFVLGFFFIITRFGEIEEMLAVIRAADWRFFSLAVALQALWFAVVTAAYNRFFMAVGVREQLARLFLVVTASNLVTILTPSGGMTGLAVFLTDARRRGHSIGHVSVACALYLFSDYATILFINLASFPYLNRTQDLDWPEITAASVLAFILLGLGGLLYLGTRSTRQLGRALAFIVRGINRVTRLILKRNVASETRAHLAAKETAAGVRLLRQQPGAFVLPVLLVILNKLIMLGILETMFLAFHIPFSPGQAAAGFGLGYLFAIVTPSPSAVGVVESLLTLALTSVGVRLEAAAVITLGYRAVTFWIPFFVGLWTLRQISQSAQAPLSETPSQPEPPAPFNPPS